ncbi:AAA family ATPase [Aureimonas sp. AU40]|uniref:AAA family ATPase n=1 Tax=Aureimonas sp. AU40 TaxID=1637747 RepID=UPI000782F5F7|nr:AAA family ATPase [Aureimonas sp. AU40]
MLIGLSGAHRSGKTTVMESLRSMTGMPTLKTSTAKLVERLGIDLAKPMTLVSRIEFQTAVFENYVEEIGKARSGGASLIVDRTPVDMAAYLLAEVGMSSHKALGDRGIQAVNAYAELCRDYLRENFAFVFVLRPLPVYEVEPNKPAPNFAYQQHYQMVIEGFLAALQGQLDYAIVPFTDHDSRVAAIKQIMTKVADQVAKKGKRATLH